MTAEPFVVPASAGASVLDAALAEGLAVRNDCAGHGHCGRCRLRYLDDAPPPTGAELELVDTRDLARGARLGCQHRAVPGTRLIVSTTTDDALIQVDARLGAAVPDPWREPGRFGVAIDLGTTTLALALVDLATLEVTETVSRLNPQARFGADVLSRIGVAIAHGVGPLRETVRDALGDAVVELAGRAGVELDAVARVCLAGNTTMSYLLRGLDPAPLAVFPFTAEHIGPAVEDAGLLLGVAGLDGCAATLMPGISAYVGPDIVAGLYYLGLDEPRPGLEAFCDIGTNGEIALLTPDRIVCTATAAGPAFEGASTSCGVASVTGAVNRVWSQDGTVRHTTIGDAPAVGLCGSAIVDLLALGVRTGRIAPSGRLPQDLDLTDTAVPITMSQNDVRNLQLAKAAIRTGIEMMLDETSHEVGDLDVLWIAGGFGTYLDKQNASQIGLLPDLAPERVRVVGNSALGGCVHALYDPRFERRCARLVARATAVDLSSQPRFSSRFIANIPFPQPSPLEVAHD